MDEELGSGREVIVDDVIQEGDIYATGSHISHNEYVDIPSPELGTVYAACCLHNKSNSGQAQN